MIWTCDRCGTKNDNPLLQKRKCVNCGYEPDMYDLPEEEESEKTASPGYY